ncbi:MAG TPA: AAA family ATPase [Candidatus Glassbacteria bacterium]|nr:AAA family ATPase [Candidatus Glassbacteria bacterium]
MEAVLKKLKTLQSELEGCLIERGVQIEALLAALVAGAHVLLLGPPGTAKSLLVRLVCNAIEEANYFEWLLTKFSTPEELFGPISMNGLKNDEYRRITKGKLPEAHVGFVDEIFKGNSAIQNTMLTILNEKKFHNNGSHIDVPLISCIGASNELPQGEELGALYDRFVIKFWVNYISDDDAFCDLLDGSKGNSEPTTKLTLDEIKELQKSIESVTVSRDFLNTIREIHHELERAGVTASDRRWKAAIKVMRAYAVIRGQTEVTSDELEVLADILWHKPEDRKIVYNIVAPRANPLNLKAVEFLDSSKEIYKIWQKSSDMTDATGIQQAALQANGSLNEIGKNIKEIISCADESKTKKLKDALETIKRYQKEVVSALGL